MTPKGGNATMCRLCDAGKPRNHFGSRRTFLKASAATGVAAAGSNLFAASPAAAQGAEMPRATGRRGTRFLIKGGYVMTMDPALGNFVKADVLIDGAHIVAVEPNIPVGDAQVINAAGRVVMPGFVDTHHHLFETGLRSYLPNGILVPDGTPAGVINYFEYILLKFAPVYRPQDVYINELFGSLSQLNMGVTTVHDISQIHHSPSHSNAAVQALKDSQRRAVFGYFESAGGVAGNQYPQDARRIKRKHFTSNDQLVTMIMGGEIYLPGFETAWAIGRELGLQVAAHIVGTFGMRPTFDNLAATNQFGPDNLFIHMTGMSSMAWRKAAQAGAHVSLAVPIEMVMRHGMPPIQRAIGLGFQPSLSSDVECTMTSDFFTQMRSCMGLQRAIINEHILNGQPPADAPDLLTCLDVLKMATINGAKGLRLDHKTGSLTPGKEADIILLDATAMNVVPLNNVPGAVVTLMDTSNVETVIVAGKIRKWKGQLLEFDLPRLRNELENSRDFLFQAAGIPHDLFRNP
jgi:cytosine/adenosine deaminase-related metal-dependent hydrolase